MGIFWKSVGAAFVTIILVLALERQSKDFALMITIAGSAMLAMAAAGILSPVMDFLGRLESLGNLNGNLILSLLKILGVGITGEISSSVCTDAGNSSLGKGLRFLSNAAIMYLSIPLFSTLVDLIQQMVSFV